MSRSASGRLRVGSGTVGGGVGGFCEAKSFRRMTGGESRMPTRWIEYSGANSPASSASDRGMVDFEGEELDGEQGYTLKESVHNKWEGPR